MLAVSGLLLTVLPLLLVVVVVLAVRRANGPGPSRPLDGQSVRRFFHYLLLYGLLVVVASGLSGLLGRVLGPNALVSDPGQLARGLSFTVVGLPLFVGLALWSRRRLAASADEASSLGWGCYVTVASLTSLLVAMTALDHVLRFVVGLEPYSGSALARLLVWGASWGVHWRLDARVLPPPSRRLHHLVGSLVGLLTAAAGLAGVLAGLLRSLPGLALGPVLAGNGRPLLAALVVLAVGVPVWIVYWARTTSRGQRGPLWLAYVLLVGVAGGMATAIVCASMLAYDVLVWLVGHPATTDAALHFHRTPGLAGAAATGVLLWWYHRAVLAQAGTDARGEVRRIYEYLVAGLGLLAAGAGVAVAVVAFLQAVTGGGRVIAGGSSVNSLLAAATLLAVGVPVWWLFWRRVERAARSEPAQELASPTRRVYLFVLFGLGGVAAVVALLVGVYLLFEDVVAGNLGAETLRRTRFCIGVLLATGAIAGYHWAVYRADRERLPTGTPRRAPRFVLLVGPADPDIARLVAQRTDAQVQAWSRTDDGSARWSLDEVTTAMHATDADELVVLCDADGVRAIPVRRP
ncbi:MAG: DUF5671 domain-containing protein [Actinomycetes bacterium]